MSPGSESIYIWDQLVDEGEVEFKWFRFWYEMGPTRNFRSLSMLTGVEEFDLRAACKRYGWDLRVSQREAYQTSVLSQFFQDDLRAKEMMCESVLNDTLSSEIMILTQQIQRERSDPDAEAITIEKRLRRAERMMAIKNQIVKTRGERPQSEGGGITINVLPRDLVDAINDGTSMKNVTLTHDPRTEPTPNQ